MNNRPPLTDENGEVRELHADDFWLFKPAQEVLPEDLQNKLGMRLRGRQKLPSKISTTIRLSPDVL